MGRYGLTQHLNTGVSTSVNFGVPVSNLVCCFCPHRSPVPAHSLLLLPPLLPFPPCVFQPHFRRCANSFCGSLPCLRKLAWRYWVSYPCIPVSLYAPACPYIALCIPLCSCVSLCVLVSDGCLPLCHCVYLSHLVNLFRPAQVLSITVAHEIGHNFGAQHDQPQIEPVHLP